MVYHGYYKVSNIKSKSGVIVYYLTVKIIVRLAVHLPAIIERFPHDAILHFTSPEGLSGSGLRSLLSLPKATTSTKSSDGSLRQRNLREVSKEPDETHDRSTTTFSNNNAAVSLQPPNESKSTGIVFNVDSLSLEDHTLALSALGDVDKVSPPIPKYVTETIPTDVDTRSFGGRSSIDKRQSSQSIRPLTQDSDGGYVPRPKVKLGPRPSLDYDGRPKATGSRFIRSDSRPVAALPAGVRLPSRKPVPVGPQAQQNQLKPKHTETESSYSTLPTVSAAPTLPFEKNVSKAGNTASMPTFTPPSESKQRSTTLEKQRLMKALQMRQKQMAKRISEDNPPTLLKPPVGEDLNGKSADDDSVLIVMGDAPPAEGHSDILHLVTEDLEDISNAHSKASPISIPEPSEGPSTQTSSIAGAEDPSVDELSPPSMLGHEPVDHVQKVASPHTGSIETANFPDQNPMNKELGLVPDVGRSLEGSNTTCPVTSHEYSSPLVGNDGKHISCPFRGVRQEDLQTLAAPFDSTNSSFTKPRSPSHLAVEEEQVTTTRPSTADTNDPSNAESNSRKRGLVVPIRVVTNTEHSDDNFLSDDSFMEELQSATVQEAKPMSVSRSPITPVFPKPLKSEGEASKLSRITSHAQDETLNQDQAYLGVDQTTRNSQHDSSTQEQNHLCLGQEGSSSQVEDAPQDWNLQTPEISPLSPRQNGVPGLPKALSSFRATSNPLDSQPLHSELQLSPRTTHPIPRRSASISPTPRGNSENTPAPISKKLGVSTGISQRIKALEKFTMSPDSHPPSLTSPIVSPSFVSSRKTSIGTSPVASTTPVRNGWSFRRKFPYPTPSPSPSANAFDQGFSLQRTPQADASSRTQPTSVTVRARIIRDMPDRKPDIPVDPSEPVPMNLHHSPLIVERQASAQGSMLSPTRSPNRRPSSIASNLSASADPKREALLSMRRESFASGCSTPSRRGSDNNVGATLTDESSNGIDGPEGSKDEKKGSKRTRLFKRMSSMSSASRWSIVHALSPSVKEEEPMMGRKQGSISETLQSTIYIGDVNIQFPDTLVCIMRNLSLIPGAD